MAFYIAVDLAEPGISPNLWVVSPFFEPMKFAPTLTGTSYQPAKVDLAALAKEIPPRPLPVSPTSRGYQVGPFPTYGSFSRESYSWVSETGLALHPGRDLAGLVDLPRAQGFPLNEVSRHSMGVSPDNSRVAYTQNGYLVVRDVPSGEEKKWALTKTPDSDIEISVEMLSWSPNGRFLIGAWRPPQRDSVMAKLWVLDWETCELTGLIEARDHSFHNPAWSPDSNQVVLLENFIPESDGYDVQWVLADLPTATTRVVVPRTNEQVQYRFSWNPSGELQITTALPGPDEIRAFGYDPVRKISADNVYAAEDLFVATQLRFLTAKRKEAFWVDLLPALEKTGLPIKDINWLFFWPFWSPDGSFIYLEGDASGLDANSKKVGPYRLHGSVDLSARKARFLPAEEHKGDLWFLNLNGEARWSGNRVLLTAGQEDRKLRILDAKEMKVITIAEGQEFLAARWTDSGLVYASTSEVGLIEPDGSIRILFPAPKGEAFVPSILQSPSGRYLAIPRERPDTDGPRWIIIEVLDLAG